MEEEIDFEKRNITYQVNHVTSKKDIPDEYEIITVVYAGTTLFYNAAGLNSKQKKDMIQYVINTVQSGTSYTRHIVYSKGNINIIY